jgi:hypothetical protein
MADWQADRIVVPIDFSADSARSIATAVTIANRDPSRVYVVHVLILLERLDQVIKRVVIEERWRACRHAVLQIEIHRTGGDGLANGSGRTLTRAAQLNDVNTGNAIEQIGGVRGIDIAHGLLIENADAGSGVRDSRLIASAGNGDGIQWIDAGPMIGQTHWGKQQGRDRNQNDGRERTAAEWWAPHENANSGQVSGLWSIPDGQ